MSSNDPAAADNNRHHTETYRSYEDWASSNLSDAPTGEPSMFAPGELERINKHIADRMGEPLELDEWWDAIDEELANLPTRVVESATGGRR